MSRTYATKWITLRGSSGSTGSIPTIQLDDERTFDVTGANSAQADVVFSGLSGCTFYLEGRDIEGDEYIPHFSYGPGAVPTLGPYATAVYLSRTAVIGASDRIRDRIRWRVTGSDNWMICFRISITAK